MELTPFLLTDEDLKFIKRQIWEPIPRNEYYKRDFKTLGTTSGEDYFEVRDRIIQKWRIAYPMCSY
jgi:hypothetical protein